MVCTAVFSFLALDRGWLRIPSSIDRVGRGLPTRILEAARAYGMSRARVMHRIILHGDFRQALPAYGNEIMLMVKSTSLASTITILEVTGIAKKIVHRNLYTTTKHAN